MKKTVLTTGILTVVVAGALLFPQTGSAFWPFDKFFGQGEVKGEQTDKPQRSIRSFFVKETPTATPSPEIEKEIDEQISEKSIEAAVNGRLISAAQRKEMIAKLAIIRARRAELKKLQEAFKLWMKENNIDPKILIESRKPSTTPSVTRTRPGTKGQKERPTPIYEKPYIETTETQEAI